MQDDYNPYNQPQNRSALNAPDSAPYKASTMMHLQSTIVPERKPMRPALVFLLLMLGASSVVDLLRIVAYTQRYQALGTLISSGAVDSDTFKSTDGLITLTLTLRLVTVFGALFAYNRWVRAGHANAMSHPALGLGWLKVLPGGRLLGRAYLVYIFSVFLLIVFARQPARADWSAWQTNCEIQIAYSAVRIVVALVMIALIARITTELERRLALPVAPQYFGAPTV